MASLTLTAGDPPRDTLERAALLLLLGFAAALQLSIFAAELLLFLSLPLWLATAVRYRDGLRAPAFFVPLLAYAAMTLVSSVFSIDPRESFIRDRQLFLLLIVPAVYQLARGRRAFRMADVIITVGAISAIVGIVQYGILDFDYLGRRPHGALGHYMTYSGLLMLVIMLAASRLLFRHTDRIWPALVMPALAVALGLTFTRSAWVGACVGLAVLLSLRDFRLLAILPVVVAISVAIAPARLTDRVYSMFDLRDPTNRDRVAMLHYGLEMVRDHPLTGVGPNMIPRVYAQYRDAQAVNQVNPHLHNVPLQIAAERGLLALAAWIWFMVVAVRDLWRNYRRGIATALSSAALASLAAMLAAGFFEYNFGDSEFMMLLLVVITLPFAADQHTPDTAVHEAA